MTPLQCLRALAPCAHKDQKQQALAGGSSLPNGLKAVHYLAAAPLWLAWLS